MEERRAERTANITLKKEELLQDISETGAALNLKKEFKNGNIIKIKLQTKNHSVAIKAKVVRSHFIGEGIYRTGVHFIYIEENIKATIEKIVDEYSKGVPVETSLLTD